jgi:hypothetical protein
MEKDAKEMTKETKQKRGRGENTYKTGGGETKIIIGHMLDCSDTITS